MKFEGQFAKNLIRCRKAAGLSQEALSFRAGLHRTEIGMLERGVRTARVDTLVKLAGGLGVTPNELLDELEWQPPDGYFGHFVPPGEGGE